MALDLLDRWSPEGLGLLLESPAEINLAAVLEAGPGTNARAVFARADGWRDALRAVAEEPAAIARSGLIVFPQVTVLRFRPDFMVVCSDVRGVTRSAALPLFTFFVECDGRVGHVEDVEQIKADLERERAIRAETGLAVLRFSGAEVMYQQREVEAVIGAQVEALAALREHGTPVKSEADAVLEVVARLSCHRALRSDFTARNAQQSTAEPYDPMDPLGADGFPSALWQEADWDDFLDLRMRLARLRHSIARGRLAEPGGDGDEPDGELRPFHEALLAALETIAQRLTRTS